MKQQLTCLLALFAVALSAFAQAPDDKGPAFPAIGKIKPRSAKEITSSQWSIGGETLDRDYAIYNNYKSYLGPLGAKAIRLQAGWAKCEKEKGVYSWAWLDEIIDDALAQGVQPWVEPSYGNPIYPDGGGTGLGAGFPKSPEALAAWDKWVRALVQRYKNRVREWEVWNEPDLRNNKPADYADLFIRTATIIRAEQPDSKIYIFGLAGNLNFAKESLDRIKELGKIDLIDAMTIHGYPTNPDSLSNIDAARKLAASYSPKITVRQGETGCPSTANTFGALREKPWSELTQAKWDLRRMLAHRAKDVPFNLFTLMELDYDGKLNTKGKLKSNKDKTVERPKPAYFAAQNVFAIFDDTVTRIQDFSFTVSGGARLAVVGYQNKQSKPIITLYLNGAVPGESNQTTPLDITLPTVKFTQPIYADLRTGIVYSLPKENWSAKDDGIILRQIPLYDSPIIIAEKDAFLIEPLPAK